MLPAETRGRGAGESRTRAAQAASAFENLGLLSPGARGGRVRAHDLSNHRTKAAHYPDVDKSQSLGEYIAPVSGHSRGATVDLTMLQCDARDEHCRPLDMGTPFDLFDPRAHTDSKQVTATQRANRELLLRAMAAQGFENYSAEWWHYTPKTEPQPTVLYDVPVQ